jgi:transcriptional regulator with XRE-family HTH domain
MCVEGVGGACLLSVGDQDMEHVGARLRRWRIRRGLSQRVLAELAGFSQGYVAQIESGAAPLERRAAREALAQALQISVGELTGRHDDRAPGSPVSAAAIAELRAGIVALAVPVVTVRNRPMIIGSAGPAAGRTHRDEATASRAHRDEATAGRTGGDAPAATRTGRDAPAAGRTGGDAATATRTGRDAPAAAKIGSDAATATRTGGDAAAAAKIGGDAAAATRIGGDAAGVDVAALDRFYVGCRYDLLVPALAEALTMLASREATGWGGPAHLRSVVEVCSTTVATCVQLGHPDLTLAPAGVAMRAAEQLGEPAYLGLANYARIRAVGGTAGAERVVDEGIGLLQPYVGTDPVAAAVYGMHHLIRAEMAARACLAGVAAAHLDEADAIAAHTGERPDDWFSFGPTNVGMWRLAVLVALGEGPAAAVPPPGFHPEALPSAQRRATYFIDLSRALLQGRGRDDAAAAALFRAEVIAPQQVCASDGAREALRTLLSRPRYGRDGRLRGLAGRAGIRD